MKQPQSKPGSGRPILTRSIVSLICALGTAQAANTWTGTVSQDWNDILNWNGAFPVGPDHTYINTAIGNTPIISADSAFTPVDILVGNGVGAVGLLDHRAGIAATGLNNWMFVGVAGGTGTYNLADSTTTGGTLTGMGLSTGSMKVGNTGDGNGGRLYVGGRDNGGGGIGTVNVNTTGSLNIRNDLAVGSSSGTGIMNVDAGTITTGGWNFIGKNEGGTGANGTLRMSGGTLTNTGRTYVGQSGSTGKIELTGTGKYLNVNNEQFIVGEGAGSNGQIIVNGAGAELRSEGELWIGQAAGGFGTMTVSAGTVSAGNWFAVGRDSSSGVLTINGTGLVQKTDTDGTLEITNFGSTTASGIVNLDGGTLRVNHIDGNGGVGSVANLFLNGGLLKSTVDDGNFIAGNVSVFVKSGGAIIDTDGRDITIAKGLIADTGSTGGLVKNGTGALTLTGANTFTGAVAVNAGTLYANPGNGANGRAFSFATGITVASGATLRSGTNGLFGSDGTQEKPITVNAGGTLTADAGADVGVNVVTLVGGTLGNLGDSAAFGSWRFDGAGDKLVVTENSTASAVNVKFQGGAGIEIAAGKTLSFTGTITDTTNGGLSTLTKSVGTGTLDLSGVNTFTGPTTINTGTVVLSGAGSINNSSGVTVDGAGAKLIQKSTSAVTPVVTVTNGAIDGTGAFNTVTVANLATNLVANGAGTPGSPLTIGSLSFLGAGKLNLLLNGSAAGLQTTSLTTSGAPGAVVIDASNNLWNNGTTYNLLTFTTHTGTLANFTKGTISGLGARQNATLGESGTAVTLAISGDLPLWTGAGNGTWTTAVQSPTKNWKLQTAGTATDFLTNDVVIFDDTATGTTVNIIENVSPISTTFNNATKDYTVTNTGGFGIAAGTVTKTGNAILIFGGNHTYTGATTLSAGVTNLTGTLGNTAVTVANGATLNLLAANAISQNTLTVNGILTQQVPNSLSGTASLVLNSGGFLTQSNNHSGGITLNNGTLNINHANALGTGTFTLQNGVITNSSPGAVTLTTNNPIRLVTGLTFTGTRGLNFGTGPVALGTDASAQTINIDNGAVGPGISLTIGGAVSAPLGGAAGVKTLNVTGIGGTALTGSLTAGGATGLILNANGPGALVLSGVSSLITTLYLNNGATNAIDVGAGNLTLSNGGGDVFQSSTGGTINGTGGGTITIGSQGADFGTAAGTALTVNAKIAGTNRVDFYNSNPAAGLGTIILAGDNPMTGGVNVENTKVIVPAGGTINGTNVASGPVNVGTVTGVPATLEVTGGTVNANAGGASVLVGAVNGATSVMNITGGAVNAASEVWIANSAGSNGTLNMSGGSLTMANWLAVGRDGGTGTINQSGGTITKTGNGFVIVGSLSGTGTYTQTAGTLNVTTNGVRLGENNGNNPSLNTVWDMQGGTATITGEINVAWRSAQATWNVSGNSTVTATGRLIVGAETWTPGANNGAVVNGNPVGTMNVSSGNVTITGGESRVGGDAQTTNGNATTGAVGIVNVTGGTLNFGNNIQIGAFGQGTMSISGTGAVNSTAGFPVVGRFAGGVGVMNVDGGTFTQQGTGNFLIVGEAGTGTLNLNSGLVDVQQLRVGHVPGGNGTLNLNGGVLATSVIQQSDPTAIAAIRLNGTTLKAKADAADFILGVPASSITVEAGGAIIDTNGFSIGISPGLAPGAGNGGLTKKGNGTLTLNGVNTYTGPTVVEAGTLTLNGSVSGSTTIDVRSGATLDGTNIPGGLLVGGATTLKGSGNILGSVVLSTGAKLSPGASPGTLVISDSLDLSPAVMVSNSGTLLFELGTASDQVQLSFGQLAIGTGVLGFDDFVFSNSGGLAAGTYKLFDSTLVIDGSLDSLGRSGTLPNGFIGTLALADSDTDIVLVVVPEPGSAAILLAGLGSLVGVRRVRRQRDSAS